jgi:hypothetical protein
LKAFDIEQNDIVVSIVENSDADWSFGNDATQPLETRLIAFYEAYLPAVFRYDWVRIFVFAGLRGVGISQRYPRSRPPAALFRSGLAGR